MASVLTQGPAPVATAAHGSQPLAVKTNIRLVPGLIYTTASVETSESQKDVFSLAMVALNKQTWATLNELQRKNLIEDHKFIYLKMNDKNDVLDIGVHVTMCKQIEALGLSRVILGDCLLPKDVSITAMSDTSYSNMLKRFLPQLV